MTPSSPPLSLWQALEEELLALGGTLSPEFAAVKARYLQARTDADAACAGDPDGLTPECQRAVDARERAERDYASFLFDAMHEHPRTALCLSGGGIRSATFGLGIVQALAHYSTKPGDTAPPGLLGEFDYVSTVSGGGYLGGWLSAWRYWHPRGMRGVIESLAAPPTDKLDPEPPPLRHLRNYTAYLTPRTGTLSADTWTLIATYIRNIVLNWIVLLPLLAAVLMIPLVARAVTSLSSDFIPFLDDRVALTALLLVGFVCLVVPTTYIASVLPSFAAYRRTQPQYFAGVLVPLCAAAMLLSTFWAWFTHAGGTPYPAAAFVKVGAAAHLTGAMFGGIIVLSQWHGRRAALVVASMAATWLAWTLLGYWAALLVVPAGLLLLYRSYWPHIVSIVVAALATGALAGWIAHGAATGALDPRRVSPSLYTLAAAPLLLMIFGLVSMLLVAATSRFTRDDDREWWARSGAWLLLAVLAWLVFGSAVLYGPALLRHLVAEIAAAGGLIGLIASRLGFSGRTTAGRRDDEPGGSRDDNLWPTLFLRYGLKLAAPAFFVLLVLLLAIANDALLAKLPSWIALTVPAGAAAVMTRPVALELVAIGLLLLPALSLAFLVNINIFSLHGMYRSRLIRAYLGASNPDRQPNPFTGFDPNDNIAMSRIGRARPAMPPAPLPGADPIERPLHVINIALNLVKGDKLAWQQRKAESFTVTTLHAGSCRVGYQPTARYGDARGIDIGTAITISGAAASPNMGYHSSPMITLLMALFNARLGWWLPNPGKEGAGLWSHSSPRWAVTPWLDEAFGLTTDRARWVYLSDGGHFENLALYEMVLRRCRLIVVVDAGADPDYTLEDLGNAVRKVRVDFGIPIDFPGGIHIRARQDPRNTHCAVGRIRYHCVDGRVTRRGARVRDGFLVYIKPALNGNEPPDVTHYAASDPRFPQQPTTDQWFDEAQFESYRRLGSHVIDELLGPHRPYSLRQFVREAIRQSRPARAQK